MMRNNRDAVSYTHLVLNGFPIFRNVATQHTETRAHGIQQRQRQTFQIGRQDEHHRIRQQFIQNVS